MKEPNKKSTRQPPKEYQHRLTFDDGSIEILSNEEAMVQLNLNAAKMFTSDAPTLRELGKRQLVQIAKLAAKYEAFGITNKISAGKPRPDNSSELKPQIISAMRAPKKEGKAFHEFMLSWEQYPINGLRLIRKGTAKKVQEQYYIVEEEHGDKRQELQYKNLQTKFWPEIK